MTEVPMKSQGLMAEQIVCLCGHTDHWHSHSGTGDCEHDGECRYATWGCKIGEIRREKLPNGSDSSMRDAIEAAYFALTGEDAQFTFSGWGARLSEGERAVVEDREPDRPASWRDMADMLAEAIRLTREYVGEEKLPPIEGWSWYDALEAYKRLCEQEPI